MTNNNNIQWRCLSDDEPIKEGDQWQSHGVDIDPNNDSQWRSISTWVMTHNPYGKTFNELRKLYEDEINKYPRDAPELCIRHLRRKIN